MGDLVVFNGGLMRGQSAHWKMRGATFLETVQTAPAYRLFSIGDRYPAMLRDEQNGLSITAELYDVPEEVWLRIDNIEPPGLYRGPVELSDGRMLEGMLGEPRFTLKNGRDISNYGSWPNYPYRTATARMDKEPDDLAIDMFICGPYMRGLAQHEELQLSPYLGLYRSEPRYKLYTNDTGYPLLIHIDDPTRPGASITGEMYRISRSLWPSVAATLPPGLRSAPLVLEDYSVVQAIMADPALITAAMPDISSYGDWRTYLETVEASQ